MACSEWMHSLTRHESLPGGLWRAGVRDAGARRGVHAGGHIGAARLILQRAGVATWLVSGGVCCREPPAACSLSSQRAGPSESMDADRCHCPVSALSAC